MAVDSRLVAFLIEHGAKTSIRDNWSYTPLHLIATHSKDPKAIEILLANGAEVNSRAEFETTPLGMAMGNNSVEIVDVLLRNGADPKLRNQAGRTPLHSVARYANQSDFGTVIRLLVKYGADVNAVDDAGVRPIDLAEAMKRQPVVDLLRALGAKDISSNEPTN